MKKTKTLLTALVLCSFCFTFSQNTCEDKITRAKEMLFENSPFHDETNTFKLLNSCADQGSVEAESLLGLLYLNGMGVPKNDKKAFELISNAAKKDFALAQYNLGRMYKTGTGCSIDFKEAIAWFEKATANGNQRAAYAMGYMYYKGLGVPQSYEHAIEWFEQSNDPMATHFLGLCYYLGYGVEPNENKALELLLNNPISNSETLVGYLQKNQKQKIEKDVNQVLEANTSETQKKLALKTTAFTSTATTNLEPVKPEEISGNWEGKLVQYDWSGKSIMRILPIHISFNNDKDNKNTQLEYAFLDQAQSISAVLQDDFMYFKTPFAFTLERLYSSNPRELSLDYEVLSIDFKKQTLNNSTYLMANMDTYVVNWKEYGPPTRLILKPKNTLILTEEEKAAQAAEEEMLLDLATQKEFIKGYPVPFESQLHISFELETAQTVQINLTGVNSGETLVIEPGKTMPAGNQTYNINTDFLSNGLYVIKVITPSVVYTRIVAKQ